MRVPQMMEVQQEETFLLDFKRVMIILVGIVMLLLEIKLTMRE